MANFEPVRTLADLETLDQADLAEGYMTAQRGDPEPGPNRGRSFWHGWRNRMIDYGELPMDDAAVQLVNEFIRADRAAAEASRNPAGEAATKALDAEIDAELARRGPRSPAQ